MKTIERMSIVEQVIQNLIFYIEDNHCAPGDKMPTEKEICERLGVGRSTVREAYRMLQAMGRVEAIQGKGVFVTDVEEQNKESGINWFKQHGNSMIDFMEIRTALEVMGVRLAVHRASGADIKKLEEIHQSFLKAIKEKNENDMASYDEAFHNQIAFMTHNTLMVKIQEVLAECFSECRVELYKIDSNQQRAVEPHAKLIEALKERDEEKAAGIMMMHLEISLQDMQRAMENK